MRKPQAPTKYGGAQNQNAMAYDDDYDLDDDYLNDGGKLFSKTLNIFKIPIKIVKILYSFTTTSLKSKTKR